MTPFESYLEQQFMEQNPQVLDDDLSDGFNNWMCNLAVDEWIVYADKFALLATMKARAVAR